MLPEPPLRGNAKQQIDRLGLENVMLEQNSDESGREQAFETWCILLLLLCLIGILIYGSLSSTTVVVAAPPGLEVLSSGPGRAAPLASSQ
jgi:hypothetical protein